MTRDKELSEHSPSTIELGRVRACGGLLVSVNRSWQVPPKSESGNRPVAAFKGMAPIAPKPGDAETGRAGDTYLAAVSGHDAFWLGFEVDKGQSFAVIPYLDGICALTERHGQSNALQHDPRNFLVVPDQPWFDCVIGSDGLFRQLVPGFAPEGATVGRAMGEEIRLVIYELDAKAIKSADAPEPDGPVPMYSQEDNASRTEKSTHVWPSRDVNSDYQPSRPCVELTFLLVEPEPFRELTGIQLPADMFDNAESPAPPPHNPFGP